VQEAWSIGRTAGVPLADDYVKAQLTAIDMLPAEMKSSMLHDLEAGRRLEAPGFPAPSSRWRWRPA
jgi:2-dehydropantoate 2-reductase